MSLSNFRLELEIGDEVAGITSFQGCIILVTRQGYFYEIRFDGREFTVQKL